MRFPAFGQTGRGVIHALPFESCLILDTVGVLRVGRSISQNHVLMRFDLAWMMHRAWLRAESRRFSRGT